MRLDKELEIESIKKEIEENNFKMEIFSNHINIVSPNNVVIIISKPRFNDSEGDLYYIDCLLSSQYGLCNFFREWKDKDKLKSYIVSICIPTVKHLCGYASVTGEQVKDFIKTILKEKKIDYIYSEKSEIKRKTVNLSGDEIFGSVNFPCFFFNKKGKTFCIYLQSSSMHLAELDNALIIQYAYPWYLFCPVYKKGEDYVRTTITNFLEFIETLPDKKD